ncbi:hypothetical protein BKN38_04840 [Helicobacter sp. CLO-3]|uniref:hypothetical protein n=1 Tax=unclassified Helicobacter TaxID=2593540 RepID=UPI0008052920|nr:MULTISPECIES: hypothetical protein [unclassified Helicobacter]OBV28914.1 hypothetical protein BA723_07520 [Helicobacter sp. CLO-3]OHU83915.1 hypothetical protein BKN38_04840 [Helicobacter sp. CLO-3]
MGGGLVYGALLIVFVSIVSLTSFLFIANILCLFIFACIKSTTRFINLYFIIGEFFGAFAAIVLGFCIYALLGHHYFYEFFKEPIFYIIFAFLISFFFTIPNMLLLLIIFIVFRYELGDKNALNKNREIKNYRIKSIVAGILLSLFAASLCMGVFYSISN